MKSRFSHVAISDLVAGGFIAPHPIEARERIEARFECKLSQTGGDCSGISELRRILGRFDPEQLFARCLVLCAAHTHWDDLPIIESYDATRQVFLAGPKDTYGELRPISFVFSTSGLVPFEWIDTEITLDSAELDKVYEFLVCLNREVVSRFAEDLPIPLGISIDYRFKKSLFDRQMFVFLEGAHDEEGGRAVLRPSLGSIFPGYVDDPEQIQVTWTSYIEQPTTRSIIAAADERIFRDLEDILRQLPPYEALAFMDSIESELVRLKVS